MFKAYFVQAKKFYLNFAANCKLTINEQNASPLGGYTPRGP
jgi:hypothetical protein